MKRGFTLIELLAVIVMLAIIALIAATIVLNIINDSKKESMQRSIDLYMDMVKKVITKENIKVKYKPDECEIQNNGNVICYKGWEILKTSEGLDELKIEMNGETPSYGIIYINNNKLLYKGVVLNGFEYELDIDGIKSSKAYVQPVLATTVEDYRGYYADVDGDGEVDGIIYADLAHSRSGNWGDSRTKGIYSYETKMDLREYVVSDKLYTGDFGTKKIIKIMRRGNKNFRFYVMDLKDFKTPQYNRFYWYKNAYGNGKMNTYETDTSVDFGTGYTNTRNIILKWNAAGTSEGYPDAPQHDGDIWKHIQEEYAKGWYVPSRGELGAFGDYLSNKEDNPITTSNYNTIYKLSACYWTSSQYTSIDAWRGCFGSGGDHKVSTTYSVRLTTNF